MPACMLDFNPKEPMQVSLYQKVTSRDKLFLKEKQWKELGLS